MEKNRRNYKDAKKEGSNSLRAGMVLDVVISSLNEEGFGVSSQDSVPILIPGALPGESIKAKVTYVGKRETFAKVIKVIQPSADRNCDRCCDNTICDGCPLLSMKYEAQLSWKKQFTAGYIGRYKQLAYAVLHPVIPSPRQFGYRNSAKLVVAGKYADPAIGIYRRNTHEVLEVAGCAVHHPLINKVIDAVRAGIKKGKVPIYNPKSEMGLLRYLVVRVSESTDRAMVVFVTAERSYNEIHHLAKHVRNTVPEVAVIAQNVNGSRGNVIFGPKDHFLTKEHSLAADLGDVRFLISPRSFFQINSGSARIIYDKVREWGALTGKERVLDLYCGIGGISLFLARVAQEVIGIEVVDAAVADAERNAHLNGIDNCSFIAGDVARLVEEMREDGEKVDLIVLNPPRKGCEERVLKEVALLSPAKLIYVSCSPESLARDLNQMAGLGYQTREIQPVDMFPQTPHVENVALLVKNRA